MKKNRPLLTISILISDRPDTVEKCLKSLDMLREKVSSELILVDTGCGEQVREIIERYADVVVNFPWCNDFAKARNAGFKQAKGEWFLYMDDDEWFEDTVEIEQFFLNGTYKKFGCAVYYVRNYVNSEGTVYSDDRVGRMFRIYPDMKFIHKIHENIDNIREPMAALHSFAHHYGYAFKTEEEKKEHTKRNMTLLLEELEENPHDLRDLYQLAQEYMVINEYEKATEICERGIRECTELGQYDLRYFSVFCAGIVRFCLVQDKYEEIIERGEKYIKDGINEFCAASIMGALCIAYSNLGNMEQSALAAAAYLISWKKQEKDRDIFVLEEMSLLCYCFLDRNRFRILITGISAVIALENQEKAAEWFSLLNLESPDLQKNKIMRQMVRDVAQAWLKETETDVYQKMLKKLIETEEWLYVTESFLDSLRKEKPELLRNKKDGWEFLTGKDWKLSYLKLWANLSGQSVNSKRAAQMLPDFQNFWKNTVKAFPLSLELELWDMAERVHFPMREIIEGIPFYRWEQSVQLAITKRDWETLQTLQRHLEKIDGEETLHLLYWNVFYRLKELFVMAKHLTKEEENKTENAAIVKQLKFYASAADRFYRQFYREELFKENPEILPLECQLALKLSKMFIKVEKEDFTDALADLKELAELTPELAEVFKCCAKWIKEEVADENETLDEKNSKMLEFDLLAWKVKEQIRLLVESGYTVEALTAVEAALKMLPKEPELLLWKEQLVMTRN